MSTSNIGKQGRPARPGGVRATSETGERGRLARVKAITKGEQ